MSNSTADFAYAEAWRPDRGDILEGVVTEITQYDGGGYGSYPIVTVKQDDGTSVAVHAFHTVLRNELARLDVQVGEGIAILYAGPQKTRDGKAMYEGYRVKMPGRTPKRFNWGADEGDGDPTDAADLDSSDTDDRSDLPF
jgi:hypothetical protein